MNEQSCRESSHLKLFAQSAPHNKLCKPTSRDERNISFLVTDTASGLEGPNWNPGSFEGFVLLYGKCGSLIWGLNVSFAGLCLSDNTGF